MSPAFDRYVRLCSLIVAQLVMASTFCRLCSVAAQGVPPESSTPSAAPVFHWPRLIGCAPAHPFLFRVPASGSSPLSFSADGLPAGLVLNRQTGVISGSIVSPGTSKVEITATNAVGKSTEEFTINCDHKLALTPPMGWDSTDVYGTTVTDAEIRDAADRLVATGLAAHGYQYVLLGDSWQGKRDSDGELIPNGRFPDMKALVAYVHSKGLKFGLYSSATSKSSSGFTGSFGSEALDAAEFASWGVDYITYDWSPQTSDEASADPDPAYMAMGQAVGKSDRDIIFYARVMHRMGDPAQSIDHVFEAASGIYDDLGVITKDAISMMGGVDDIGPGHWNALGPLQIGRFGYPDNHMTRLSLSGQEAQISLWSLFSAPLILSCDLDHLDSNFFNHATSSVLMNDEVISIDQDGRAEPPQLLSNNYDWSIWMKPLSDGRSAVAMINCGSTTRNEQVSWSDLGLTGSQPVRDLWLHQNLGVFTDSFETDVPPGGVSLIAVGPQPSSQN